MTYCRNRVYGHNCGKCAYCRAQKAKEWALRLTMAESRSVSAVFLTLTYCDEHLPPDGRLVKSDLQKFFKRLRRYLEYHYGKDIHLKYFSCGEYGDRFHRPHYHAIIWSKNFIFTKKKQQEIFSACWKKGFVKTGSVTEGSIRYVTGYVLKKQKRHEKYYYFGSTEYVYWSNIEGRTDNFVPFVQHGEIEYIPPFNTQSLGIGSDWFELHLEECIKNGGINFKGNCVPIPSYFVRKYIYKDNDRHLAYNSSVTFNIINSLISDLREAVRQHINPIDLKNVRIFNREQYLVKATSRRESGGKLDAG